jgi:translation initiation factor 1 (eIF-1/SUI1)
MSNSRLVYSTDDGDRRERTKRSKTPRGPEPRDDVGTVAADLKRLCGSGGTVKDGAVELQGDHREKVAGRLRARGYEVKLAGG